MIRTQHLNQSCNTKETQWYTLTENDPTTSLPNKISWLFCFICAANIVLNFIQFAAVWKYNTKRLAYDTAAGTTSCSKVTDCLASELLSSTIDMLLKLLHRNNQSAFRPWSSSTTLLLCHLVSKLPRIPISSSSGLLALNGKHNWACLTWKSAIEIKSLLLLLRNKQTTKAVQLRRHTAMLTCSHHR